MSRESKAPNTTIIHARYLQTQMNAESFSQQGWCRFAYDTVLSRWVQQVLPSARATVKSKQHARWLRCGGTWFAGVNALPNDARGTVAGGGPLGGVAVDFIHQSLGIESFDWDRGQVSVCYPGYPQPMTGESAAAFRFRRDRDAAHVDGLLPEGKDRRRHLREHHGFVLGIPMVEFSANASPFVVWEGSHNLVRDAFTACFKGLAPDQWCEEDITEVYRWVRQRVFATCKRIELAATPGEAFIVHRLLVHGIAPWATPATAGSDGRMICYFRPEIGGPLKWLTAP